MIDFVSCAKLLEVLQKDQNPPLGPGSNPSLTQKSNGSLSNIHNLDLYGVLRVVDPPQCRVGPRCRTRKLMLNQVHFVGSHNPTFRVNPGAGGMGRTCYHYIITLLNTWLLYRDLVCECKFVFLVGIRATRCLLVVLKSSKNTSPLMSNVTALQL